MNNGTTRARRGRRRGLAALGSAIALALLGGGAAAVPALAAEPASDVAGQTFVIGTDTTFAPFEMTDTSGELVGIDMDLIRAVADDQGFTVDIKPQGFDAAVQALQVDQVDAVIAGMSITDERKKTFDFSSAYFQSGVQMAVSEDSDVQSLEDLQGQKVAVKTGTEGASYAQSIANEYGFELLTLTETTDTYEAVKSGQAEALVDDYPVLGYSIQQGNELRTIGDRQEGAPYGIAVNKGQNAELLSAINTGLGNIAENGTYDEILERYLGDNAPKASDIVAPSTFATDAPQTGEHFVIGTDSTYAPFEFTGEDGEVVGIDMDLLRGIAANQGFTVEIKRLGFDAAVQALQAGQVDAVIAGMTITDEREKVFDFTEPYFDTGVQLGVLEDSDIASYDDLEGQTVAVKTGTQGQTFAESVKDEYGFDVLVSTDTTDMVDAVKAGQAVGYFEDYPVLAYGIAQGSGFKLVGDKEVGGQYGAAVNKGENAEFIELFNAGLANAKASGFYDEVVNTYLGTGEDEAAEASPNIFTVISTYWPQLLDGLKWTVLATLVAVVAAFILGIAFGFARISRLAPLRWIATAYVYVFRGTPILIQAFFIYFALPAMTGIKFDSFTAGALTLSLNAGAYMTEIVRSGIQAVDPGQAEASRSLGLGYWTTMRKVVLPQAFKIMIPSFVNQGIITLKDTSLLSVISLAELTFVSKQIIASTYLSAQVLTVVAIIYFTLITLLTLLANRLERKFNA
ncbi:ABC transporter substrate-binding protein/permease [Mycetocola reblochoni]|uniref:/ Glutamine transport system permease protein GlnP (TC 3.A.1.3.2) n=1 Tax=Mycetocola reblochoni REB411 TaxID=1255698 RepID=A0A1R4IX06_9MICO|nr:ABC transporter substrate-binding protein/permease [Mycetocola reblochoni]SJN23863.1 / Glutamine transport system permease protein GlnP (TC 3.A.1.3.2) [Mycetocola reblochoni REB411]